MRPSCKSSRTTRRSTAAALSSSRSAAGPCWRRLTTAMSAPRSASTTPRPCWRLAGRAPGGRRPPRALRAVQPEPALGRRVRAPHLRAECHRRAGLAARWPARKQASRVACRESLLSGIVLVGPAEQASRVACERLARVGIVLAAAIYFSARAFSIALSSSGDSGLTPGWNRETTSPLRLTRNLAKFQGIGPACLGSVASLVRNS